MSDFNYDDVIGEFKLRSQQAYKDYQEKKEKKNQDLLVLRNEVSYVFDKRKAKKLQAADGRPATIAGYKDLIFQRLSEGVSLYTISKEIGYNVGFLGDYLLTIPEYVENYSRKKRAN